MMTSTQRADARDAIVKGLGSQACYCEADDHLDAADQVVTALEVQGLVLIQEDELKRLRALEMDVALMEE